MWKNILLLTLGLSIAFEAALTVAGFFAPAFLLGKFNVAVNSGTLFMAHVVAWFTLLVDGMIAFAIQNIIQSKTIGWTTTFYLSSWWVLLGISIYFVCGRSDNLVLDSLKGIILLVAAAKSRPKD